MTAYPFIAPALRIEQQLGVYYVAVLPARVMLDTCYSDRVRAIPNQEATGYTLEGTQRGLNEERLKAIARYIGRVDSAFPNSIILSANFREEDGVEEDEAEKRWTIEKAPSRALQNAAAIDRYTLRIPTKERLAAVIDGQHRLFAFALTDKEGSKRLDTQLICSVFLDLPKPFQAQLFATINSTQKPVDKSLTYELFGYNIAEEEEIYWSPDKLAVFLARKLNAEKGSPLKGRIIIAPENDIAEIDDNTDEPPQWKLSMATIVEGRLRLISSNPKRDTAELLTPKSRPRSVLRTSERKDKSPLRDLYVEGNDKMIYLIVRNFLAAADEAFWKSAAKGSFITKTVGIQALLDILRKLCSQAVLGKDIRSEYFAARLENASKVDFSNDAFREASGSGRTRIRRFIEVHIGLLKVEDLKPDDDLRRLIDAFK